MSVPRVLALALAGAAASLALAGGPAQAAPAPGAAAAPAPGPATPLGATPTSRGSAPSELYRWLDPAIRSSSGLAMSSDGELFYTHGDAGSGGSAVLYAVSEDGFTRFSADLLGTQNEDWEDIAVSRDAEGNRVVVLADTGDAYFVRKERNQPLRTEFSLVVAREPQQPKDGPSAARLQERGAVTYPLVYSDRGYHNAETLLVSPNDLRVLVIEKVEAKGKPATVWQAPYPLSTRGPNVLTAVGTVPVWRASGGDISAAGDRVVIRNDTTAYIWPVRGADVMAALEGEPETVPLPAQQQGEGVTFSPDGRALYVSSEGKQTAVWQVPLPAEARAKPAPTALEGVPVPTGAADDSAGGLGLPFPVIPAIVGVVLFALLLLIVRGRGAARARGSPPREAADLTGRRG